MKHIRFNMNEILYKFLDFDEIHIEKLSYISFISVITNRIWSSIK